MKNKLKEELKEWGWYYFLNLLAAIIGVLIIIK